MSHAESRDVEGIPAPHTHSAHSCSDCAKTGKTFPQVWIVKHPKARIVGITLGHDARAHDLPDYQTLLKNAVKWVSEK